MSKIVILGAGISGLITSIALAHKGIKTILFDKNVDFDFVNEDLRNISLTNHSCTFLKGFQVWYRLEQFLAQVRDIYVLDNKSTQMLHFSEKDTYSEFLGYMIPYKHLHTQALNYARSIDLIDMRLGKEYTEISFCEPKSSSISFEDGDFIIADLVIACDGKNSPVKKRYFERLISRDYKETALVFNVSHEKHHEDTAIEHFTHNGTFAVLPLKNQHESSIVWSLKNGVAEAYMHMSKEKLEEHVLEAIGTSYGAIKIISNIKTHKLSAEITKRYFYNNIVLISDSAHTIHPLAGQGLNQGIRDIESLVNIIWERFQLGLTVDQFALREYEKSRAPGNLCMFAAMHALDKVFVNNYPVVSRIKPHLLGIANKLSILKKCCIN